MESVQKMFDLFDILAPGVDSSRYDLVAEDTRAWALATARVRKRGGHAGRFRKPMFPTFGAHILFLIASPLIPLALV